ncbi:MAG: HAD family hydrolase [Acidimicrobiales bacterium]
MEAAFFDLDKTVIATASMVAFGRPFYREGLISRRTILRSLYAQLVYMHLGASEAKLTRIRESVLALTKGWEQDRVRSIVAETLEEIVAPIIYGEALDLIEAHQGLGRKVYIVSASPEEIVAPLARHLGADGAVASRPQIDADGRYTGNMDFYAYGPFKAEAIRSLAESEGIDLDGSFAYSDSYTDLPMLEAVGHPVAVNPDRILLNAARDRDWEVRQFVRRVPLQRSGRTAAHPVRTAALAGIGLAGAGAVLVGWRLESGRRSALARGGTA